MDLLVNIVNNDDKLKIQRKLLSIGYHSGSLTLALNKIYQGWTTEIHKKNIEIMLK